LRIHKIEACWVWWCTPVIPAPGRLRQEDLKFRVRMGYITKDTVSKKKSKIKLFLFDRCHNVPPVQQELKKKKKKVKK
jgi:hypothetical protein